MRRRFVSWDNLRRAAVLLMVGTSAKALVDVVSTTKPVLEVPEYRAREGSGNYTGFNSVNLQEVYVVEKQPAERAQIGPRGGHKPCLARLPNGDLLASQFAHGEITLYRSKDQGLTWGSPQGTGFRVGLGGRAAQFSALRDGTLLLAHGRLHRSTDEGKTWQECRIEWTVSTVEKARNDLIFGESDGPHEMADGTVLCSAYIALGPGRSQAYLLRSKDGGRTWGDGSYIADASEVNIALLPEGRLFGCLRVASDGAGEGGAMCKVVCSADAGRTWSKPRSIGLGRAQVPGFPLRLPDGRLLILYGNRQFPFGVQAIASTDGGQTWDTDHPVILAWFSWDNYCGHPRSVVLGDGSIVTGYYARVFKENANVNQDVVGHTIRWRPPKNWPPTR